jgi:ParB-like chromosome segregation protein Spo0J
MSAFSIVQRDPASLTPYANNAKAHPTEQIDKVAASIASFKFDQPIVVDARGVIIKGHARREAALRLGLTLVPVLVRDDLNDAQVKALRLADNRAAESAWLSDALTLELASLGAEGFDLGLTGFDQAELDRLLAPEAPPEIAFPEYDERLPDEASSNGDKARKTVLCPHCGGAVAL